MFIDIFSIFVVSWFRPKYYCDLYLKACAKTGHTCKKMIILHIFVGSSSGAIQ